MIKIILPATTILLTACSNIVPNNDIKEYAEVETPGSWTAASVGQHGRISTSWLQEFNSPLMTKIVREAISNNPSLNAQAARLRAAKEGTIGSYAALLPSVRSSSGGSTSRSGNGSAPTTSSESYNLSLNVSWEPDIWGRLRDLRNADIANYRASIEDYRAARLSLAANTASAWCNLITAENQLQLAIGTLNSFQKNETIIERNYKAGVPGTRAIAVQLSRNNVASAKRSIDSARQSRDEAARVVEELLGRYPSATLKSPMKLPTIKSSIPSHLPATLLTRRPDLAEAQLRVYQSAKIANSARKNLLPSISLSSGKSTSSQKLRNIFDPAFLAANIAASLTQSVYQGGELKADARAALYQNQATIQDFTSATISAYREVEDALAAEKSLAKQEEFLLVEVRQASLAEKSAELDYSEGVDESGILEILESQRRASTARSSLISLRNQRIQNRIDLHLALGGDFDTQSPTK